MTKTISAMVRVWVLYDTHPDSRMMEMSGMNKEEVLRCLCLSLLDNDSCKVNVENN